MDDTTQRAKAIAEAARNHLLTAGWTQGCFYDADRLAELRGDAESADPNDPVAKAAFDRCPMCLMGAINMVTNDTPLGLHHASHEDLRAVIRLRAAMGDAIQRLFRVRPPRNDNAQLDPGVLYITDFNDNILTTLDDVVSVLDTAIVQLGAEVAA